MAETGIYAFQDAQGVIHFTNVPADPRYSIMIREPNKIQPLSEKNTSQNAVRQERYIGMVEKAAREHNVDPALLRAIIAVESGYDPRAVSRKGAVGLMQLMPDTAKRYGVIDRYDPLENIHAGTKHVVDLMRKFNNNLPLTLAAYNAGENAVVRHGNNIPPYRETLLYVPRVMQLYRQYRSP